LVKVANSGNWNLFFAQLITFSLDIFFCRQFVRMADFAMSNLYATQFHDGLDVLTAWRFAQLMKELFGALAQLEEACLPVVKQDGECMEVCLESRSGIPSAGSG
jgi:hypothetical protein